MTEQQLNTLKVAGVIAGVVVVGIIVYPLIKGLSDTAGNVGKIASDITGTVEAVTGALNKGAQNVAQYIEGNPASSVPGYKQGAWSSLITGNPQNNPLSPSYVTKVIVPGVNAADQNSATAIVNELNSFFYVSPSALVTDFIAIPTQDDVAQTMLYVNANIDTPNFNLINYLSQNLSQDWLDALAGNIMSKPVSVSS